MTPDLWENPDGEDRSHAVTVRDFGSSLSMSTSLNVFQEGAVSSSSSLEISRWIRSRTQIRSSSVICSTACLCLLAKGIPDADFAFRRTFEVTSGPLTANESNLSLVLHLALVTGIVAEHLT